MPMTAAERAALVQRHTPLVVHICGQDEDRQQDGFLGLLRAIDGFDPSRGLAFSSYAWPAIWRAAARRKPSPVPVGEFPGLASPIEERPEPDQFDRLYDAMRFLSPRHRQAISLLFWHGRSLQDAGAKMGLTGTRVSQLRDQALGRLREILSA